MSGMPFSGDSKSAQTNYSGGKAKNVPGSTAVVRVPFSVLSKIQSDRRVWLGTAHQQVPRSGLVQRFRVITNRSAN